MFSIEGIEEGMFAVEAEVKVVVEEKFKRDPNLYGYNADNRIQLPRDKMVKITLHDNHGNELIKEYHPPVVTISHELIPADVVPGQIAFPLLFGEPLDE